MLRRYPAGVHPGVHVRADIAVPTALDESDRAAAAEPADAVSVAHEGDAGERPGDLRQGAQARSACDRVELGTDVPVGAHDHQQRAACHGETLLAFAGKIRRNGSRRRVIEETPFASARIREFFPSISLVYFVFPFPRSPISAVLCTSSSALCSSALGVYFEFLIISSVHLPQMSFSRNFSQDFLSFFLNFLPYVAI